MVGRDFRQLFRDRAAPQPDRVEWLRVAGHLSPHAWAVDAFGRLGTTDSGISGVVGPVLLLATIATLLAALAVRRLSRIVGN